MTARTSRRSWRTGRAGGAVRHRVPPRRADVGGHPVDAAGGAERRAGSRRNRRIAMTEAVTMQKAGRRVLRNIPEIRTFFRTNEQPVYFIGATAFNLLGLDRWVRNFNDIAYYDSRDG